MTTEEMYEKFGIKKDVIDFGKTVLGEIEDRFAKIDEVAEINQLKVIHAMQKNRVSENHLWGTTGYGYNDTGRDTLEQNTARPTLTISRLTFMPREHGGPGSPPLSRPCATGSTGIPAALSSPPKMPKPCGFSTKR